MNIQPLARSARLYARAEAKIAEIRFRILARKLVLSMLATGIALLALVFLNVAMFKLLESVWGPVWTPLILGLANLLLAAGVLMLAAIAGPGRELALAEELRKASAAQLEAEFGLVLGFGGSRTTSGTAQLLVPALALIIDALRRRKPAPK